MSVLQVTIFFFSCAAHWKSISRRISLPDALKDVSASGNDILLDIDFQGAAQLKKSLDNGVYIFILPPDYDELQKRLEGRNSDSAEVVQRRIENARQEVAESGWYDYIVVNDNFDFALAQLKAILMAETCRTSVALPALQDEFEIN